MANSGASYFTIFSVFWQLDESSAIVSFLIHPFHQVLYFASAAPMEFQQISSASSTSRLHSWSGLPTVPNHSPIYQRIGRLTTWTSRINFSMIQFVSVGTPVKPAKRAW
jgi:hypothetical protein